MTEESLGIAGRVVLVTGAASGIGLETARFLASLGARVVAADREAAALAHETAGISPEATAVGDITVQADCSRMVGAAAALGQLHGVVHCAGVSDMVVTALDTDIADWQRVVDITLRGTFLICQAAGRIMVDQGFGSIVTMSSVNGLGGIPRRNAYAPAKAAVAALTRNLACEWSGHGVRINAIAPGYVETPLITRLIDAGKIDIARLEARTPAGRLGRPIDIARTAAFLLSDWSDYVTGATIPVDGGWMAYGGPGDVLTA